VEEKANLTAGLKPGTTSTERREERFLASLGMTTTATAKATAKTGGKRKTAE
jgi:hypothetical protein